MANFQHHISTTRTCLPQFRSKFFSDAESVFLAFFSSSLEFFHEHVKSRRQGIKYSGPEALDPLEQISQSLGSELIKKAYIVRVESYI